MFDVEKKRELQQKALELRKIIIRMCQKAGTGHVTSSFSCVEILTALYYGDLLNFDISNDRCKDRDRFILSKGQASVILYCILGDLGFFPKDDIWDFCSKEGKFGVHLQDDVKGVEITTGSLGHGLGVATGIALAHKLNQTLPLTYVLLGDGECYEGSIWESAMFASHNNLNNLIAIVDRNFLCATHFTESEMALNSLEDKWRAFGWEVKTINGHNFNEIFDVLGGAKERRLTKPLVIIAETVKGKGVEFMSNKPLWHAVAPSEAEAKEALGLLEIVEG